jgi:hypothetical protein
VQPDRRGRQRFHNHHGCQAAGVLVRGGHLGGRSVASSDDDFRSGSHRRRWDQNWDPGGDGGGTDGQNLLRLSGGNRSAEVVGLYSGLTSGVVQFDLLDPYGAGGVV